MDRISLYYFHQFGVSLGGLRSVATGDDKLSHWRWSNQLQNTRMWLESFSGAEPRLLPKTEQAARTLSAVIDDFQPLLKEDRDATISEWKQIVEAIDHLSIVYEQEVEDVYTFFITSIGAYSLVALVEKAYLHLSKKAQDGLNAEVKRDFSLAGSCLAFDLYTASGFHAMRALEAQARSYHKIVTAIPEQLSETPLGPVINGVKGEFPGLRDQWTTEGSKNDSSLGLIISMLSLINKIYRCPIMHPEMTLDREEAKQVFDVSAIAISAMVTDGEKRGPVGPVRVSG